MKIISTGVQYDVFPDDIRSFDRLPADYYVVRFVFKKGFFLEKYSEFSITDDKIYGVHLQKVKKVLRSFHQFRRNLGVILSGDKGIGKSLFARLLGVEAIRSGIPVIVIDTYYDGIGSFIERIDQEVMVLFDEFDKTFAKRKDEGEDPQSAMLSLFDGVSSGKKLFVVTCNELKGLNSFLVNRPGRFHYHFRFEYPKAGDIRKYLEDNLENVSRDEVASVISFSRKIPLNYDCLRAIAFELNHGLTFADAIKDLNIVNTEREWYRLIVEFHDGTFLSNKAFSMDTFSADETTVTLKGRQGHYAGEISFIPTEIKYHSKTGELYLNPEDVELGYETYDEEEDERKAEGLRDKKIKKITIQREQHQMIHYAV